MSEQAPDNINKKELFNPKVIKKGIFYFVGISIVAFTALFLYTNTGKTLEVWSNIEPKYIAICLVIVVLDMLIGGWRNHIFVRELVPGTSQWVAFKGNLANIFMGAVTPSQSGGGLAQMYIFYKNGIKIADAVTISFINWLSTLIFLPLSGFIAYQIISDRIPSGFITYLAQFGLSIFTTLLIVIMVALFFPSVIGWIIVKLSVLIGSFKASWKSKLEAFGEKAKVSMVDYRNKTTGLLKRKPYLMLFSFVMTIALYINKYLLAYFIVLALGVEADFWTIIAIQAILLLLLYFAPSPGGSGIAEISTAGLMVGILSTDYVATFTLLLRSFLPFVPAIIGAVIVMKEMNKKTEHS